MRMLFGSNVALLAPGSCPNTPFEEYVQMYTVLLLLFHLHSQALRMTAQSSRRAFASLTLGPFMFFFIPWIADGSGGLPVLRRSVTR